MPADERTAGTPEYGVDPVPAYLEASTDRFSADGLPVQEIRRAARNITSWDEWWPYWMDRAEQLEAMAGVELVSTRSQADLLILAMLAAHWAQFLHFHQTAERETALRKKIRLYGRAAELLLPGPERVEVPFGQSSLPAWLRVPDSDPNEQHPCVIYVGGLDAHKEDSHTFVELCLERGMATFAFDGPGQGEARLSGLQLEKGAHLAISSCIDRLETLPNVDNRRIAVIGRSLGGFTGPRAAADDPRIKALAVWGAMFDLSNYRILPAPTRAGFRYVTGAESDHDAMDRISFIDMTGHGERIQCPTLIVHGSDDALTPPSNAIRLASSIGENCRLEIIPDSPHCNHNVSHLIRPKLADWLATMLEDPE